MKLSKVMMWIAVGVAAVFIVWRVGFYPSAPAPKEKPAETQVVSESDGWDEWSEWDEWGEWDETRPGASESQIASGVTVPVASADVNEPKVSADANAPARLAEAGERRAFGRRPGQMDMGGDVGRSTRVAGFGDRAGPPSRSGRITDANDANEPMELLNLKNVEMRQIVQKIAEWTGKTVIPAEEAERVRVSIYAPEELPRSKALAHIYGALRLKGFVAEHLDNAIYVTPVRSAKLGFVPTIPAEEPLALLENKDQIVQKFFKLASYNPAQMAQVIQPLIGEYGYVSADETTRSLLVIDTVQNLMRLERIIVEFDVPESEQTVTAIFPVEHGDPSEIVQMLKILLGETQGYSTMRSYRGSDRGRFGGPPSSQPVSQPSSGGSPSRTDSSRTATTTATSVVVTSTRGPIVLIPEPRRKWIIARASAEDMKLIDEWITKLDRTDPVESEYETVQLRYADAQEVQRSIEQGFRNIPGTEFLPSIVVESLPASRQVLIFGRKDLREMVKKIIAEMDIPPGQFETEYFKLKYADPDQIKANIDELYQEGLYSGSTGRTSYTSFASFGYSYGRRGSTSSADMVKVLSYASLKQVTVIASPEIMQKIRTQIEEWDRPLDVNEVKPRIIELRNSDPVQLASLLNTLFSESSTTGRVSVVDMMYRGGMSMAQQQKKIVGPLYGQLTFQDVPGTRKIIVISKIPEAYDVVEQLVLDIDKEEMAQIPKVVTLKYANPEDLAERLNALFNEMGTTAAIRRSAQGLAEYSMETGTSAAATSTAARTTTGTTATSTAEYRPPWNTGRTSTTEQPISNVIGKVRFIPDIHSKSILVLAPPQFMADIEKTISELDVPGKQVMIRAIVMEIDHAKATSLGIQLATNTSAFGTLEENAITALASLTNLGRYGSTKQISSAAATGLPAGSEASATVLRVGTDVYGLIDFLIRKTHAKVLNQQTVWTKDNEEATFFKGQKVPFSTGSTVTATGVAQQSYEFQRVGMTLRGRPSITPEKSVDMIVNVILSQLTTQERFGMPYRSEMETTTNMIVKNGQTIMLGGILSQEDSRVQRKLPLLGDIPLIGGLFGHEQTISSNNELIVFITPYVVDELENMLPEAEQELQDNKSKLEDIQQQLKDAVEPIKQQRSEAPKTAPQGPNNTEKEVAKVYYRSIESYRCGRFEEAREGFLEVVRSDSVPQPMRNTAESYLSQIDNRALYAKGST